MRLIVDAITILSLTDWIAPPEIGHLWQSDG